MGICALGEIFQAKGDELLSDIEGVKTYSNDILVVIEDIFEKHIEQLRTIFGKLRAAGLKVNAPKCSLGLKEIPYLGYITTREVIKYDPNKV